MLLVRILSLIKTCTINHKRLRHDCIQGCRTWMYDIRDSWILKTMLRHTKLFKETGLTPIGWYFLQHSLWSAAAAMARAYCEVGDEEYLTDNISLKAADDASKAADWHTAVRATWIAAWTSIESSESADVTMPLAINVAAEAVDDIDEAIYRLDMIVEAGYNIRKNDIDVAWHAAHDMIQAHIACISLPAINLTDPIAKGQKAYQAAEYLMINSIDKKLCEQIHCIIDSMDLAEMRFVVPGEESNCWIQQFKELFKN